MGLIWHLIELAILAWETVSLNQEFFTSQPDQLEIFLSMVTQNPDDVAPEIRQKAHKETIALCTEVRVKVFQDLPENLCPEW